MPSSAPSLTELLGFIILSFSVFPYTRAVATAESGHRLKLLEKASEFRSQAARFRAAERKYLRHMSKQERNDQTKKPKTADADCKMRAQKRWNY